MKVVDKANILDPTVGGRIYPEYLTIILSIMGTVCLLLEMMPRTCMAITHRQFYFPVIDCNSRGIPMPIDEMATSLYVYVYQYRSEVKL